MFWCGAARHADVVRREHLAARAGSVLQVRALARAGPLTHKDGARAPRARARRTTISSARRIFHALRRHAHLLHTPESALWTSRPLGVFRRIAEPEPMDVLAARTSSSAATSARSARRRAPTSPTGRACASPTSPMRSTRSSRCAASATRTAASCSTSRARRSRPPTRPRRCASCRSGTTRCSRTPTARACCPRSYRKTVIGEERRRRRRRSSSTASSRAAGRDKKGKVALEPFAPLPRVARREVEDEAARLEAWLR